MRLWLFSPSASLCASQPETTHCAVGVTKRQWVIDAHAPSAHLSGSTRGRRSGELRDAQPLCEVPGCGKTHSGHGGGKSADLKLLAFPNITSFAASPSSATSNGPAARPVYGWGQLPYDLDFFFFFSACTCGPKINATIKFQAFLGCGTAVWS